jgi:hypothetical protein
MGSAPGEFASFLEDVDAEGRRRRMRGDVMDPGITEHFLDLRRGVAG